VLIHKQPDDIWRVDYQLRDDESEIEALQESSVRRRVGAILQMIGERAAWELEWWSLYKAYSLALDEYRHGPVLFLGDAAHLVPIFGVRGLNSGLADAMNAAWKLAYVIHGHAPHTLLDSYSIERRGATLDVFDNAAKSTRFMTPPTRGYRLMRDAALSLAVHHEVTRPLVNPRQSSPYAYADSPLTALPARDHEFDAGPVAGAALINRRLGAERYLLDRLGVGFSGLYFSEDGTVPPGVQGLFRDLAVGPEAFQPIVISRRSGADADGTEIFDAYGAEDCSFYLIRPDRHVAARWRQVLPDEARRAFRQALGG
jgi:3-(3-hydroxy-phenyl)propionate hydroxylase